MITEPTCTEREAAAADADGGRKGARFKPLLTEKKNGKKGVGQRVS